jgi:large subunit ribosomal protein L13
MPTAPKCFQARAGQLHRQWFVIDATDLVVGRLAARIAPILMGKHRPTYTPHIDTGDFVIVTNVDKVVFTGKKWQQKTYQRYSGYPGGQSEEAAWKLFQRQPERILKLAVQRMLPKTKMGREMMTKLKLYVGPNHPHQAQQPLALDPIGGTIASAGLIAAIPPGEPKPKPRKVKALTADTPVAAPPAPETAATATETPAPTPSEPAPAEPAGE